MKKIVIVGGGNAGCLTALYCAWHGKGKVDIEVELIHNPKIPPERVGQGTVLEAPALLWAATGFNWYDNNIHATFKSGILYEGWGKKNKEVFHPFPGDRMAMHFCPWEMQQYVLNSGYFKVRKSKVLNPSDIDADSLTCLNKPDTFIAASLTDIDSLMNFSIVGMTSNTAATS